MHIIRKESSHYSPLCPIHHLVTEDVWRDVRLRVTPAVPSNGRDTKSSEVKLSPKASASRTKDRSHCVRAANRSLVGQKGLLETPEDEEGSELLMIVWYHGIC